MGSIKIVRGRYYADWARKYKIVLDGTEVGKIAGNSTWESSLPPGRHTLVLKVDWCRSQIITFDSFEDSNLTFDARPKLTGWKIVFAITMIFFPKSYIRLSQIPA
ncbi:MAG: hypothetical protein EOP06_24275 [Proteobacteria bacterium]|nr:MAG: hypothetical protein EOP06_24275 [Pseudomonadota bacterium]